MGKRISFEELKRKQIFVEDELFNLCLKINPTIVTCTYHYDDKNKTEFVIIGFENLNKESTSRKIIDVTCDSLLAIAQDVLKVIG